MTRSCRVKLLDESEIDVNIAKKGKGQELFDSVCQHVNLVEKDYFGIVHKDTELQKKWVKLDKPLRKQFKKSAALEFEFAVKYYPSDPNYVKEEITKYQLCLQIRQDLLTGSLISPLDKLAVLSSYWLQSEFGDGDEDSREVRAYLSSLKYPPGGEPTHRFEERVIDLYRSRRGMTSSESDDKFLMTASGLPLYGVHFYKGKNAVGNGVKVGVSSSGIFEKPDDQRAILHPWKRIKNLSYKKSKLKVKLLQAPSNGDPRLKKSFQFESEEQVHDIWQNAVDHHVFFRIDGKDKPAAIESSGESKKKAKKRKSILRRLSSTKKKPKTEADVREESANIKRVQATVVRTSSLRRSEGLKNGKSSPADESTQAKKSEKETTPNPVYTSVSKVPFKPSSSTDVTADTRIRKSAAVIETRESHQKPVSSIEDKDTARSAQSNEDEEKDEDILKAVIEKMDTGSGSKGSSTLLLTETIPEEDEDAIEWPDYSRQQAPRATISPAVYDVHQRDMAPKATSDILAPNYDLTRHEHVPKMGIVETDLDIAAFLLDPKLLLPGPTSATETYTTETDNVESTPDTTTHVVKHRAITIQEYTREEITTNEEVEEVPLEPTEMQTQNNVRFQEKEQDIVNEFETKRAADSNSETSSTSQEAEVCYNSLGQQQMQSLSEDKELMIQELQPSNEAHTNELRRISQSVEEMLKEYIPTRRERFQSTESGESCKSEDDASFESSLHGNEVKTAISRKVDPFAISEATYLEDVQFQHLREENEPGDVTDEVHIQVPNILLSPPGRNFPPPPTPPPRVIVFKENDEKSPHVEMNVDSEQENSSEQDETNNDIIESSSTAITYSEKLEKTEFSPRFSDSTHGMLDEFSTRKFGLELEVRLDNNDKNTEGPASTTGATVGEEYTLALEELDDDILYEEEHQPENETDQNEDEIKSSTNVEETLEKLSSSNAQSSPKESNSRSTSLSDITDNTDELCQPNILEKTWSMGAGLDEDDELFQILFRKRPRRHRRWRNRSEINPHEVSRADHEAVAFRPTLTEVQSPRITPRREQPRRRRFIPSWPFDADAIFSSRELSDLDREAIEEAMKAHKELMAEERRIEEMDLYGLVDGDNSTPEYSGDFLTETIDLLKPTAIPKSPKEKSKIEKTVITPEKRLVAKSPSASPRMIGESLIPGVPDFARSVELYHLRMSSSSSEALALVRDEETTPSVAQDDQENLKYPKPILKFPVSNEQNGNVIDYTPPTKKKIIVNGGKSQDDEVFSSAHKTEDVQTSSGRSSPHSGAATSSQSELSSSTTSKASTSSFPRFIHSVFPLRRSSSSDNRRGRSKTRRKREKKIVNQKKKKNKKTDRANTETKEFKSSPTPPTIEITSPQSPNDEKFPSIASSPHYTTYSHTEIQPISQYFPSAAKVKLSPRQDVSNVEGTKEQQQFSSDSHNMPYDQESLDKIVLSDSDDAHSDDETPITVRRADGFDFELDDTVPVKLTA